LEWGSALASALSQIHLQGAVHGAISSTTIRFAADRPVLMDIAIEEVTGACDREFRAPEGGGTAAADVFALAAVIISAILGSNPLLEAGPGDGEVARRSTLDLLSLTASLQRQLPDPAVEILILALSPAPGDRPVAGDLAETLNLAARSCNRHAAPAASLLAWRWLLSHPWAGWIVFPSIALSILMLAWRWLS
jgi:hypothetical protein